MRIENVEFGQMPNIEEKLSDKYQHRGKVVGQMLTYKIRTNSYIRSRTNAASPNRLTLNITYFVLINNNSPSDYLNFSCPIILLLVCTQSKFTYYT